MAEPEPPTSIERHGWVVVIVEWATHENALAASDGLTEAEHPHYLGNWDLPGFFNDLSQALVPGLASTELALTNGVVGGNPSAPGTTATGNGIAKGQCAGFREVIEIPLPATGVNVGDSLRNHGVHRRQSALAISIERSRDLEP